MIRKSWTGSFFVLGLSLLNLACGDIGVQRQPASFEAASTALLCAEPPKEFGRSTNILLIVDSSGSNGWTDPGKQRRIQGMRQLVALHQDNEYLNWGLISFANDRADSLVVGPDGRDFGDAAQMTIALNQFEASADMGSTPYKAALNEARRAIEKELEVGLDARAENFVLIFYSDGGPTDSQAPEIFSLVERLVSLNQGQVYLSSVYYNNSNPTPAERDLLNEMAQRGKGKFKDATQDQDVINVEDLLVGGTFIEPYVIEDFFVHNLNRATCDDGTMGVDSDSDGLCDQDELRYNLVLSAVIDSNPDFAGKRFSITQRNSFRDEFSDLFMLRYFRGERLPECQNPERENYADFLNACEKRFMYNPQASGPTVGWSQALQRQGGFALKDQFDTDGDFLLDGLEFFHFKNKGAPLDFLSKYRTLNGLTQEEIFRQQISPLRPRDQDRFEARLDFVMKNDQGIPCYQFEHSKLKLHQTKAVRANQVSGWLPLVHDENENVFLVYYVLRLENAPYGESILRSAYHRVRSSDVEQKIDLGTLDFQSFRAQEIK